ncbi:drug/metabolite transporter (DMT)-like permease [Geodermatophilus bullaregiensis]|uniref:DMT family transporter n=1 Tax=Geodermatophilus bullaregiensis TaxID=1564160 RepID=UPI0027DC7FB7|nr:DMT family transporter [Geodermatophilus bullaregiensis]MBM7805356.1 drug/metabolite transporter (DMT)-like permease [Geodermatophilus bullaregiensis]
MVKRWWAALPGAVAMGFVGGSVAVSGLLSPADLFTAQAVRYAVACALLVGFARLAGQRLVRPRGTEWAWLLGVAVAGLVVFNVALVHGAGHAEPAVLGVAVACVPVALAVGGAALERRRPAPSLLAAGVVVTCGAVLVQGLGRADAVGTGWALVVLAGEAGFTLLAVPVLGRHGPWGVSAWSTGVACGVFAVLGLAVEGPAAVGGLGLRDLLAAAYLAVAVTAVAFVLWYSTVTRLGAGRAGLLTGIAPVAAAGTGVLLGGAVPAAPVWAGVALVAAGLVLGLTRGDGVPPEPRRAAAPEGGERRGVPASG